MQLATIKYFKKGSSRNLLFCVQEKLHLQTTICSGHCDKGRNARTEMGFENKMLKRVFGCKG